MTRPARVRIDLDAARHNLNRVRELAPESSVLAVIKADGYGHGLTRMASAFSSADALGVACLEEARLLRQAGVSNSIVLLEGPFAAGEMPEILGSELDVVIHHAEQIEMLASHRLQDLRVWFKIDSGMHRLGFAPPEVEDSLRRLRAIPGIREIVLMSHFANTDQAGHESVAAQIAAFDSVTAQEGFPNSLANSGAVLGWPETHRDWVRPGLMLYGVSPFSGGQASDHDLRPVMTLSSSVMAIRELKAGDPVGYGASWRAPEPMLAGIVAIGYGDGYPRHADSGAPVFVDGRLSQVLGKSSMDMLCVDLRPVANPRVGTPVELWGPDLPVEDLARFAGTVPYELLCAVRRRLHLEVLGEA